MALQQLEERGVSRDRGRVRITRIEAIPPRGSANGSFWLFDESEPGVIRNHSGYPAEMWIGTEWTDVPKQVSVHYETLTRLKSQGQIQFEPDFHVLYRSLLRRVSALCSAHTDQQVGDGFNHIAQICYGTNVPGLRSSDNATLRLNNLNELQADALLCSALMRLRGEI